MNFQIRQYTDNDPVPEITALLHRAYKPLADAGMNYLASYQTDTKTLQRLKTGIGFLALDGEKVIGTVTFYAPNSERLDWPPLYKETGIAHFGQFAVDPSYQKRGVGSMMMDHVEQIAIDTDHHTMSFDTSENAADLIRYYTKRGYEFEDYHQWDTTNYRSVLMKKRLSL